jgi:HlyD family secretion protein
MVVENGRAQRRTVKLGVRGKDKVEILEGLREGDFVLPATAAEVEEGKRLRLARAG